MKKLAVSILVLIPILFLGGFWYAGGQLMKPVPAVVGSCPSDLACENLLIPSGSGSELKTWFVKGEPGKGVIVLMHGLRSNRSALVERMRCLRQAGFSVVAFDFQGSGESEGKQLTFGYLESRDAEAALKFVKQKLPAEKIGVIGLSMGGAAFLMAGDRPKVDALVLELVYPDMRSAIDRRLDLWLFKGASTLSPLMTAQFPLRMGISVDDLRPVDKAGQLDMPVLFIAGEKDPHPTIEDSRRLYESVPQPKELWVVPGAGHTDILGVAPAEYKERTIDFFAQNLHK
jgi:pimeloyl-ACP methyl ester carboxylesterase